jgi:hypothetical protein
VAAVALVLVMTIFKVVLVVQAAVEEVGQVRLVVLELQTLAAAEVAVTTLEVALIVVVQGLLLFATQTLRVKEPMAET